MAWTLTGGFDASTFLNDLKNGVYAPTAWAEARAKLQGVVTQDGPENTVSSATTDVRD
jgi:hypothetical protein